MSANGNGTIVLTASNTFSGGIHNNQSIVKFFDDSNVGAAPTSLVANFFEGSFGSWRVINTGAWRRVTINPNRGLHPTGQSISLDANLKVVCNAPMYGGAFSKNNDGGGVLFIGGNNTNFTGTFGVNGGKVVLDSDTALGPGTNTTISLAATLDANGHSITNRSITFGNGTGEDGCGMLKNSDAAHPAFISGTCIFGGGGGGHCNSFCGAGDLVLLGPLTNYNNYTFTKYGSGTVTIKGTSTVTNSFYCHAGGLVMDYTVANSSKLPDNARCYITHMALKFIGSDAGPTTETVGDLDINSDLGISGASTITIVPGLNQNFTLAAQGFLMGNINAVNIVTLPNGSGTVSITTTNGDGFISGGAIWNTSTWAKVASGTITGMADGEYATTFVGGTTTTPVDVSSGTTMLTGTVTANTLRFRGAAPTTVTVSNGATFNLNGMNTSVNSLRSGILVTPGAGAVTINGPGSFNQGLNDPLYIHQYSTNAMTLAARLYQTSGNSIVKVGSGELILANTNNANNGTTFIFGGTLTVDNIQGSGTNCALGTALSIYMADGRLKYTGTGHENNRQITLRGPGTIEASGTGPLTFSNGTNVNDNGNTGNDFPLTLTGTGTGIMGGALDIRQGSVVKDGSGTWILGGTQPYIGNTIVTNGTLRFTNNCVLARSLTVYSGGAIVGSVTVGEDFVLNGTRHMEVRGDTDYDTLTVGYNATLGGTLDVVRVGGYRMPANLSMTIATAGGILTNQFTTVTGGYTLKSSADGRQLLLSRRLSGFIFSLY